MKKMLFAFLNLLILALFVSAFTGFYLEGTLKKGERSKRQNKRAEAREKAFEAEAARDLVTAAWQFVVFSAACGCDYIDNPVGWGATKLYKLVSDNLALAEDALITLIASKAADAAAYQVALTNAVLSSDAAIVKD